MDSLLKKNTSLETELNRHYDYVQRREKDERKSRSDWRVVSMFGWALVLIFVAYFYWGTVEIKASNLTEGTKFIAMAVYWIIGLAYAGWCLKEKVKD